MYHVLVQIFRYVFKYIYIYVEHVEHSLIKTHGVAPQAWGSSARVTCSAECQKGSLDTFTRLRQICFTDSLAVFCFYVLSIFRRLFI